MYADRETDRKMKGKEQQTEETFDTKLGSWGCVNTVLRNTAIANTF